MWIYAYIPKQNLLSLNNAGSYARSQGWTSSLVSRLVQVPLKFFHYQNKSGTEIQGGDSEIQVRNQENVVLAHRKAFIILKGKGIIGFLG